MLESHALLHVLACSDGSDLGGGLQISHLCVSRTDPLATALSLVMASAFSSHILATDNRHHHTSL